MGLGLSKSFIIFFVISVLIGLGAGYKSGLAVMAAYAVVRTIWKILT
jgi:hypothetical protein